MVADVGDEEGGEDDEGVSACFFVFFGDGISSDAPFALNTIVLASCSNSNLRCSNFNTLSKALISAEIASNFLFALIYLHNNQ